MSNDFMGKTSLSLESLLRNPGTWFNSIEVLEDKKGIKG